MKPRSAKDKGTRAETAVAAYLRATLEDDRIERRRPKGAKDCGDIAGVRYAGERVVVEVKAVKPRGAGGVFTAGQWKDWKAEAVAEAGNDDAPFWVVVVKPPHVGFPRMAGFACLWDLGDGEETGTLAELAAKLAKRR